MNVSVKKNKKVVSNKKLSKKEFKIPIYVVDNSKKKEIKLETARAGSQKEDFFSPEQIFAEQSSAFNKGGGKKILPAKSDAQQGGVEFINNYQLGEKIKFSEKENRPVLVEPQPAKSFLKPKISPRIENLSDEKKKILMWALVIFLTSFIFLGWFLMLRNNLFVERSENETEIFVEIKQDLTEMPKFWRGETFSLDSFKSPSTLNEEEISKLKEKVLETVNEKNKLNQEENKVEENVIRE